LLGALAVTDAERDELLRVLEERVRLVVREELARARAPETRPARSKSTRVAQPSPEAVEAVRKRLQRAGVRTRGG
jgi:rRNA maturation endonuclease Nob1